MAAAAVMAGTIEATGGSKKLKQIKLSNYAWKLHVGRRWGGGDVSGGGWGGFTVGSGRLHTD